MTARRTVTVSITPEQDYLLNSLLRSGRYRSISEAMRAALRLLERDEAAAVAAIRASSSQHEGGRA